MAAWFLLFLAFPFRCVFLRAYYPLDGWEGARYGLFLPTDTEFARGYSEAAFARIRTGMSMAEVESLLGRPLREYTSYVGTKVWNYSLSPGDTNYRARTLLFDGRERVDRVLHEFYVD